MAYDGNTIGELDSTKPAEDEYGNVLDNVTQEIKRAICNDFNITTLTANTTLDKTHGLVLVNATSGNITITLPQGSTVNKKRYAIKKIDSSANTVTIDPFGSETIDEQTTIVLTSQYDCIVIASDATTIWKEIRVWNATNADKTDTFHASQTPTANTIPVANSSGKMDEGWYNFYSIRDKVRNLVIQNNSTSPSTTVDITVDEGFLQDATFKPYVARSVSVSANITVSGANGLDTGTEAVSTWYHMWLIYNGTTVASLLSLSSTAPTMPSGYTYKAYLGGIYNDSSGNLITIYQCDNKVTRYKIEVLNGGMATSYTSVSLSLAIPSTAKQISGEAQTMMVSSIYIADCGIAISINSSGLGEINPYFYFANSVTTGNVYLRTFFSINIQTSQTIWYKKTNLSGPVAITISGWEY